jgi:serine/threonine-protein kinase
MGTPAFMPPEQARGEQQNMDRRTDLWAVGAAMFTLLTGRHVHRARTGPETVIFAMTKPAPPIASVRPTVPAPLAQVVDRALAFDKEARWPDAIEMQAALRRASSMVFGAPEAPPVEPPAGPKAEGAPAQASMTRAEAIAFANTLAAEKKRLSPVAEAARRPRVSIGALLLAGAAVVASGYLAGGAFAVVRGRGPSAPRVAETTVPATAAAPPVTEVVLAVPPLVMAPEPSAAPAATGGRTKPAEQPPAPAPLTSSPLPATTSDPLFRRR